MTRLRAVLTLALIVVGVLLAGYGFMLQRDRQLCVGPLCLVVVTGWGTNVHLTARSAQLARDGRTYCIHHWLGTADGFLRTEWDTDGDGELDCREDTCQKNPVGERAMCLLRVRDGRWTEMPFADHQCVDGGR